MKVARKLILPVLILCIYCAFGANIPSGSDLADMNDYYYYTNSATSTRALHALKYGGEYTLSADKVWSALYVDAVLEEPAILNLRGHTLTLNGCDSNRVRPLCGNDNTTLVISNGTVRSVYDPVAYPWRNADGEQYYSQRRGVYVSKNGTSPVGSRLVVANGGSLVLDDHADAKVTWAGSGHRFVVEKGGTFDGRLGFSGTDNRCVFKSGSTFSKISSYVGGSNFPQNIWFNKGYTSNVVEICDSKMLVDAGVTGFTPDANASAGSFHCGLAVGSPEFDFVGNSGMTVGGKDDNAPVLFEMKDGAKVTMPNTLIIGAKTGGSRSWMTLDGAGTTYKCTGQYSAVLGNGYGATNVLLRLANGAKFYATHATSQLVVGNATNASCNAVEVLSGSNVEVARLLIGTKLNHGNMVLVAGEGSAMTNTKIEIGNNSGVGGGGHSLTVTDHGSLSVITSSNGDDGRMYLGYTCGGCLLDVSDYGNVNMDGSILLGYGNWVIGCSNRVVVCSGGSISARSFRGYGNYSELIVSNGTMLANQGVEIGTNGLISVSGQYAFLRAASGGLNLGQGGTLKIAVPKEGFADRNDEPRAPIDVTGSVSFDDALTVEIDVGEFAQRDGAIKETPILHVSNGIPDSLLARISVVGKDCRIRRSSDGKTLKAVKPDGFVLFLR